MGKSIILITTHIGERFGGDAIKAWQYARFLRDTGWDFRILTHERSVEELMPEFDTDKLWIIPDSAVQRLIWRTPGIRGFLNLYFHWLARQRILAERPNPAHHILHYIAPVSPVALRLPPAGYEVVMGPFTGNIYYPPAFRNRMSPGDRRRERLHAISQRLLGVLFGDKRRAKAVLVSGYKRTRASLRLAGCRDEQLIDVVDAGVSEHIAALPRISHEGKNPAFMCSGRMVDHKGVDLAIKALVQTDPGIRLDIYGDGAERGRLEALVDELDLRDRVRFLGWISYDKLIASFAKYRGYLFPSLAEANGIVMQEAMMIGLPVVTLRWGGPAMLADDDSAIYIEPESEAHVVAELARAMDRLATDGALADAVSARARTIAETRFPWDVVAKSWEAAYHHLEPSPDTSDQ